MIQDELDLKKLDHGPSGKKYLRFSVLMLIGMKNLFYKKLRTSLTVLGVVIGIGAIVFLVSLGLGLQRVVSQQIVGSQSVKAIDVSTSKPKTVKLDAEAVNRMAHLSHVTEVAKTYSYAGKTVFQNATIETVIYGADEHFMQLGSFKQVAGKVGPSDASQIVINSSLLASLGIQDASKIVGQKITIIVAAESMLNQRADELKKSLTIVGVVDSGSGAEVFASEDVFSGSGLTTYNQVKVVADTKDNVPAIRKQIEAQGFSTTSPIDTLDQINQVFSLLNILLAGFGGIGMIIAVLGMFNTLTISLLERTKEIGLMVSLGARRRDIRRLFIVEALALSLMGAVLGLLLAWGTGRLINLLLFNLAKSKGVNEAFTVFYIPAWLVLVILIFTTLIGVIVVAYPARRAARISPIDALRHE